MHATDIDVELEVLNYSVGHVFCKTCGERNVVVLALLKADE